MTLSTPITVKVNGSAIKNVSKIAIYPDKVEIETYLLGSDGFPYVENDEMATETKEYSASAVELEK